MIVDRAARAVARASAFVAPLVLILSFQNCTSAKSTAFGGGAGSGSKTQSENGNGNGYGGMQYFVTRSASSLCADGTDVRSRIAVTNSQKSYLVRENCKDIAPTRVNVNFTASAEVPSLGYGADVFHGEQGQLPPTNSPAAGTLPAGRSPASAGLDLGNDFECTAVELGRTDSKATLKLARRALASESGRIFSHRGSLKVQTAGTIREFESFRVEKLAPLVMISEGTGKLSSLLLTLNNDHAPSSGVLNVSVEGRNKTFQISGCQ